MKKDLDEVIVWILEQMSLDNVPDEDQKQRIRSRVFDADNSKEEDRGEG